MHSSGGLYLVKIPTANCELGRSATALLTLRGLLSMRWLLFLPLPIILLALTSQARAEDPVISPTPSVPTTPEPTNNATPLPPPTNNSTPDNSNSSSNYNNTFINQTNGLLPFNGSFPSSSTPQICHSGCFYTQGRILDRQVEAIVGVIFQFGSPDGNQGEAVKILSQTQQHRSEQEITNLLSQQLADAIERKQFERSRLIAITLAPRLGYKNYRDLLKDVCGDINPSCSPSRPSNSSFNPSLSPKLPLVTPSPESSPSKAINIDRSTNF
jgi:hypothetical protein